MSISHEELEIVKRFQCNVFNKKPDPSGFHEKHDGWEGHWLENQMQITHNRETAPDLLGYEMKKSTNSKITFGDWSADYYIYNDSKFVINNRETRTNLRNKYLIHIFGKPNPDKDGRYSWSGSVIPKINEINNIGCQLLVDDNDNIIIKYYFSKDKREDKTSFVPKTMQEENINIAYWKADTMRKRINAKFNQKGWFICKKDKNGVYNEIVFGDPMSFENWINMVRNGLVFFDSGMYEGNKRPYSQWRANNDIFENLIVRRYPPFPT